MSRITAHVNPELHARVLEWAREVPDFAAHHAADGLYVAEACRCQVPIDREGVLLIALVASFWFWFDDRCDRFACDDATLRELVALGEDPQTRSERDAPELACFRRLGEAIAARARRPEEHRFWLAQSAVTFRAMAAEQELMRRGAALSYTEALALGADSTCLPSIIGAADIAHGLDRPARAADLRLGRVEHHLYAAQRLLNDFYSAEKERAEGRLLNLVLVMEQHTDRARARAFVGAQWRSHERLMLAAIAALGPGDPFAAIIESVTREISRWYRIGPSRFDADGPIPELATTCPEEHGA